MTITLLDLAKRKVADSEVGLISEASRATPEVSGINLLTGQPVDRLAQAKTIRATTYKTRVRTALPSVGFRDINEGTTATKSTTENRTVSCLLMNPRWQVDRAVEGIDSNVREELAEESLAHLEAAFQQLGKSFYTGRTPRLVGTPRASPDSSMPSYQACWSTPPARRPPPPAACTP